jgi:transketolase C-terminal domain/subunit
MSYIVHAGVPPDTKAEPCATATEALAAAAAYRKRGVINVYIVDAATKTPMDERLLRQAALRERG